MQSRLEEEEEAKVALTSRIQRLTKLILVSSKNSIPLSDIPSQARNRSLGDNDVSSLSEIDCVVSVYTSLTNLTTIHITKQN